MAGAGFKTFNTGDVLTASDVNTYLMQQTVMVFADASARSTALGANVAEGMLSYLKDTDQVEVYNGSAWVSSDDPNAIQNTIVDAKGDIITATAADTPARLPVGSNGQTLVADSSQTTGLGWAGNQAAGKNAIINGGMDIWQRGTSIAITGAYAYTADRFMAGRNGAVTGITITRQKTNDTTNLPNIEYCARVQRNSGVTTTNVNYYGQNLETVNSIPFAGQTVVLSYYARRGANFSPSGNTLTATLANGTGIDQNYLTGGYTGANTIASGNATLTTTWQRFTVTGTVPTNSTELAIQFSNVPVGTAGADDWFEITGVQLELGSSATPFSRAGGTIQGELAACQRYYQVIGGNAVFPMVRGYVSATSQTLSWPVSFPVVMRTAPTITKNGTWAVNNAGQPSAAWIAAAGFDIEIVSTGAGIAYAYPDSTDDTFTMSSEL